MIAKKAKSQSFAVLVVDDSELACESVKVTLEEAGMTVHTLNGPFGFIRSVREHRPRVILIDVGLGTMNGTKLVGLARSHAPSNTKILLYSGRDDHELARDVEESGADGYINKRTDGEALVTSVSRWAC